MAIRTSQRLRVFAKLFLLVLLGLLSNCTESRSVQSAPAFAKLERQEERSQVNASPALPRRLVRTVDLELRVTDTTAASEELKKITVELGGHVSSVNANKQDGLLYYALTLRIPEGRLDDAVTSIKKLASDVDREQVSSQDVTEQYVDVTARLKTLEATETELRALLAESRQRQQKAEDIMAIYRELTGIRSNIEQMRGQLNVLENTTALATVNVNLAPTQSPTTAVASWRPLQSVRRALEALVAVLTGLADFVILLLIVVLPTVALLVGGIWLLVKLWRVVRHGRDVATP